VLLAKLSWEVNHGSHSAAFACAVEVYLTSSYEPDAEYVDGAVEERQMGEWSHADWQAAILEFFRSRRVEWNIRAAVELRVQVSTGNFAFPM